VVYICPRKAWDPDFAFHIRLAPSHPGSAPPRGWITSAGHVGMPLQRTRLRLALYMVIIWSRGEVRLGWACHEDHIVSPTCMLCEGQSTCLYLTVLYHVSASSQQDHHPPAFATANSIHAHVVRSMYTCTVQCRRRPSGNRRSAPPASAAISGPASQQRLRSSSSPITTRSVVGLPLPLRVPPRGLLLLALSIFP